MKLKLNAIVYFLNWLCVLVTLFFTFIFWIYLIRKIYWIYSIHNFIRIYLINTQFRFELNQYAISQRKFIHDYSITKCSKIFQDYSRLLQAITLFNHLPRRLFQLGCPRESLGNLLLVENQTSMSSHSSSDWTDYTLTPSNLFFTEPSHSISCHVSGDFAFFFSSPSFNWTRFWFWDIST